MDPPLSSSRACLHTAFIAFPMPGVHSSVLLPHPLNSAKGCRVVVGFWALSPGGATLVFFFAETYMRLVVARSDGPDLCGSQSTAPRRLLLVSCVSGKLCEW